MTPACFCGRLPQSQTEWAQLLESQQKYHDSELQKWREIIKSSVMLLDQVRLHSSRQGGVQGLTVSSQSCSPSFSISCFHHSPSGVAAPLDPSPAAGGCPLPIRGFCTSRTEPHRAKNLTLARLGSNVCHWHIWDLMSVIPAWRANWF